MIRDGILKTKRYELGDCRTNHARQLRELFFATVSLVGALPPYPPPGAADRHGPPQITEDEFLDANDISKDRYFDINLLVKVGGELAKLSLPSPSPSSEATTPSQVENETQQDDAPRAEDDHDVSAPASRASPAEDEEDLSSTLRSSRSTGAGTPATRDTVSGPEEHGVDSSAATKTFAEQKEGSVEQGDGDGDVSMVDAVSVSASASASRNDGGVRTPSSAIVKPHHDPPEVSIDKAPNTQPISPPFDAEHAEESNLRPGQSSARPVGIPSSPATPITPDAQLQLEASQASKHSPGAGDQDTQQTIVEPISGSAPAVSNEQANGKVEGRHLGDNLAESKLAARRRALSPDLKNTAMTREGSKDLFLSQRPPMRIDTSLGQHKNDAQTPASVTTAKEVQSAVQTSPPERMRTRVSSGVLRHKSVSEILGETPRSAITQHSDKTPTERTRQTLHGDHSAAQNPLYTTQLASSPDSATFRPRSQDAKDKEKDRTKLSTVVFARSQLGGRDGARGSQSEKQKSPEKNKDYLVTLFMAQASAHVPTLDHLVKNANKTLSTQDHYVDYREAQDCRILKRIYHLQNSNRWSLRQMERAIEPDRPVSHWDHVLGEMKWMRTDFKEERKWVLTMVRSMAVWCAEWVACPVEHRSALQVKVRKPSAGLTLRGEENHITPISLQVDSHCAVLDSPPELIPSVDGDPSDAAEEEIPDLTRTPAPATLFSLPPEAVVFNLEPTPAADKILSELPLYKPFDGPRGTKRTRSEMLDRAWKTPVAPVSKYTTGRLVLPDRGPARKRSRYDYADEDKDAADGPGLPSTRSGQSPKPLPPEQDDVALFNPENKHIVARLHAGHAFRPPSEFPMPAQSFFESRGASQWTLAEDDELRRLVREHEYNWSLIADRLASPGLYASNAERRTPWECFERWVGFEGLPGEMARHQYFRAWNARREGARQHLEQLFAVQQQAPGGQVHARRRSAEPVGVERRKNTKHLALILAMSKVAKKRETAIQKQQHVASLAAMRKAAEPTLPRQRPQTPREMSALRHKADCERREMYRQQLAASQRVAMAQKAVQQGAHPQAAVGGMPASRNGRPPSMGGPSQPMSSLAQSALANGQRPGSAPQAVAMNGGMLPNGVQIPSAGQLGVRGGSGIPQAQMQAYLQAQAQAQAQAQGRLPTQNGAPDPNSARVIMEASRVSEQQRLMQQQRQQYPTQAPNGGGMNGVPSPQQLANMGLALPANAAALLSNAQGTANGKLSPVGGLASSQPSRPGSSPRAANTGPQQHTGQLSSGMVPVLNQISSQLKATYPQATAEQIKQMATASLNNSLRAQAQMQQHQQQQGQQPNPHHQAAAAAGMALNAAAAGMPHLSPQQQATALAYGSPMMNQQLYAQYLRNQQASQQTRLGGDTNGANGVGGSGGGDRTSARPESRGAATPQPKSGSGMSGSSQSPPHLPPAQSVNGSS